MNGQSVDGHKQCPYNTWTPQNQYTPTTTQPNYTQPYVQMPVHLSIEDRIANIEKEVKEIKDVLNQIKWRV
jgi:hypothetical protein